MLLWRKRLCLSPNIRHFLSPTKHVCAARRTLLKSTSLCDRAKIPVKPFAAVEVKPVMSGEDFGSELTGKIDKNGLLRILRIFFQNKLITSMAVEQGLNEHLLPKAFASFRSFCVDSLVLPTELHIKVFDILNGKSHVDDLFPFFMQHCRTMFPHLDCMEELTAISDLRSPPQWYPEARMMNRKVIFHAGPTNSGKTFGAMQNFMQAKASVYCGPLRMLAQEIYNKLKKENVECDLITGEERILCRADKTPSARVSCTVEMTSLSNKYDVAVIDEIQMIADPQRGWAWTRALLGVCAEEVHVCGEKSAIGLVKGLVESAGETFEVKEYDRLTELIVCDEAVESLDKVEDGDCIVCFSKQDIFKVSRDLENAGRQVAVIYGGLPPGTKLAHASEFNDPASNCNIMVATDAIGMGLNLSIRRIIFFSLTRRTVSANKTSTNKCISVSQALQIAGRAGRYMTKYSKGYVTTFNSGDLPVLKKLLSSTPGTLEQAGLHPTVEQIELYSYYLPKASLSEILSTFYNLMKLDVSLYFLCNMDTFIKLSEMLEHINLPLRVRFIFCCAPVNFNTALLPTILVKFAKQFSQNKAISAEWTKLQTKLPTGGYYSLEDLIYMEAVFDVFDLYLWLNYRFPNIFIEPEKIKELQEQLDGIIRTTIEKLLQRISLKKRNMKKALDLDLGIGEGFVEENSPLNIDTGVEKKEYGAFTRQLLQSGHLTHEMIHKLHQEWTSKDAWNTRSGVRGKKSIVRTKSLKRE